METLQLSHSQLFRAQFHAQRCRTHNSFTQIAHTHTLAQTHTHTHTHATLTHKAFTHNSSTHNSIVTHNPLTHTTLPHTQLTQLFTQLCHTQLRQAQLWHRHATLSHFHCHTQTQHLTRNIVGLLDTTLYTRCHARTHTQLFHTTLSHTHTTLSHTHTHTQLFHTQHCCTQLFTLVSHTHTSLLTHHYYAQLLTQNIAIHTHTRTRTTLSHTQHCHAQFHAHTQHFHTQLFHIRLLHTTGPAPNLLFFQPFPSHTLVWHYWWRVGLSGLLIFDGWRMALGFWQQKTEQNQFWMPVAAKTSPQVATDGDHGNRTFSNNFPSQSSMTGTLNVLKSLQGNYLRPHPHSDRFHAPRTSLTKAGLLHVHCERFVLPPSHRHGSWSEV